MKEQMKYTVQSRFIGFDLLLHQAKGGDTRAQEEIFRMYRPLLIKNAMSRMYLMRICTRSFPLRLLAVSNHFRYSSADSF